MSKKTRDAGPRSSKKKKPKGKNYILAMAIDDYDNYRNLRNAVSDVEKLLKLLVQKFQFEEKNIKFLKNEEVNDDRINTEFTRLSKKVTPNDNVLIIFAGHGALLPGSNVGTWYIHDTTPKHAIHGFTNDRVENYIKSIKSFHTSLIIDACFGSGSFSGLTTSHRTRGAADDYFYKKKSRRVLVSGGDLVLDGDKMSPFMEAVILTLLEVNDVLRETKLEQSVIDLTPEIIAENRLNFEQYPKGGYLDIPDHEEGEFVFYLKKPELEFWETALAENTKEAIQCYLSLFPKGNYAAAAAEQLRVYEAEVDSEEERLNEEVTQEHQEEDTSGGIFSKPLMSSSFKRTLGNKKGARGRKRREPPIKRAIWASCGAITLFAVLLLLWNNANGSGGTIEKLDFVEGTYIWKEKTDREGEPSQLMLTNGSMYSEYAYDSIGLLTDDLIIVFRDERCGAVDTTNLRERIPCRFKYISKFIDGVADAIAIVEGEGEQRMYINFFGNKTNINCPEVDEMQNPASFSIPNSLPPEYLDLDSTSDSLKACGQDTLVVNLKLDRNQLPQFLRSLSSVKLGAGADTEGPKLNLQFNKAKSLSNETGKNGLYFDVSVGMGQGGNGGMNHDFSNYLKNNKLKLVPVSIRYLVGE